MAQTNIQTEINAQITKLEDQRARLEEMKSNYELGSDVMQIIDNNIADIDERLAILRSGGSLDNFVSTSEKEGIKEFIDSQIALLEEKIDDRFLEMPSVAFFMPAYRLNQKYIGGIEELEQLKLEVDTSENPRSLEGRASEITRDLLALLYENDYRPEAENEVRRAEVLEYISTGIAIMEAAKEELPWEEAMDLDPLIEQMRGLQTEAEEARNLLIFNRILENARGIMEESGVQEEGLDPVLDYTVGVIDQLFSIYGPQWEAKIDLLENLPIEPRIDYPLYPGINGYVEFSAEAGFEAAVERDGIGVKAVGSAVASAGVEVGISVGLTVLNKINLASLSAGIGGEIAAAASIAMGVEINPDTKGAYITLEPISIELGLSASLVITVELLDIIPDSLIEDMLEKLSIYVPNSEADGNKLSFPLGELKLLILNLGKVSVGLSIEAGGFDVQYESAEAKVHPAIAAAVEAQINKVKNGLRKAYEALVNLGKIVGEFLEDTWDFITFWN